MSLSSLASRLKHFGQMAFGSPNPYQRPLLSENEVADIREQARMLSNALSAPRKTTQPWLGEASSVYRGSGYEFDENRLYQAGDEARFINWRLFARTGQLHVKIFHEEHRPGVFILIDRRSGMRFGTRKRLKVTQAARLACLYLFIAQQQNMQVAGVNVEPAIQWHPAAQGEPALRTILQDFIAPCPPMSEPISHPPLALVLRELYAMLPAGQQIIMISDFHDIELQHGGLLQQLAARHRLRAWQVNDPAEITLPEGQACLLQSPGSTQRVDVSRTSEQVRFQYNDYQQQRQAELHQIFHSCDIVMDSVLSTTELEEIVHRV